MLTDTAVVEKDVMVPPGGLTAWVVCLSAGLFFFYEFFQLNLFDVINQPLRDAFALDAAQLSWMSSTFLWANILFLIPAGVILDRYATRLAILMAMGLCVAGTVGFALTESFVLASFFHFLTGVGNAFCFVACVVLVSKWFPPRRQALVIGCIVTMAFLGGMIAHTPLVYLNEHYGWRHALLIDGGVGVLFLVWIASVVKDSPTIDLAISSTRRATAKPNFFQALANKQTWLAGFYTSCLNLPIMVLCALWGASYLQAVHDLTAVNASNIVSLIFIGSIIGCPLMGWISDSLGKRKPLMIMGAFATLIAIVPLVFAVTLPHWLLNLLFFLIGLFSSTQVISYPMIAESNSEANTGVATSIASVVIMGGAGIGQVLFGWLMQLHAGVTMKLYASADYNFAMWMFPIAIFLALMAIFLAKETYCKRCD